MTIDYRCRSDHDDKFPASPASVYARRALVQASPHAANLSIARWSGAPAVAAPARAAWLADAQAGLQEWLDAGGFGQADSTPLQLHAQQPGPGSSRHFHTLSGNAGGKAME